ncbi:zinc-dependent alcohol dehydrogenase family protein [Hymenobacter psoromatis]|uniref:zinc-dependent alcohol dehydrogenase family protein n=1 Tax=Hymenobacter psoromatis TaxID=1484116 RepID=UPI001CC094EC|nr:zinc-dependent alcohol dehydrogenase family protein [Hymenobacter psoromatis]
MNSPKTANGVRFHEVGGPEVLRVETVEIPAPAPHEVRLHVKAVGINRMDTVIRMGHFPIPPVFPAHLGFEAAGLIESVGSDVTNFKVGDKVNVFPAFMPNDYGTYGDLVVLPAYALQPFPALLSFEQAAAVWATYLVAYGMLVNSAQLQKGQAVLLNAASSSAGLAAIQITNSLGGISVALTTSPAKKAALVAAGAQHVIVTSEEDIAGRVQEITGGKGAEIILDAVGGSQFEKLVAAAAERAQLFAYGMLGAEAGSYPTFQVVMKMLTVKGYNMMDLLSDPVKSAAAVAFIQQGLQAGTLKPVVGHTFPLEKVADAHRFVEANGHVGKVVLSIQ